MRVSSGVNLGLGVLPTAVNPLDFSRFDADALGDTLTVTTASLGMNFDTSGVLRFAPHNLVTYSDDLSNASWTKANVAITTNQTVGRAGTVTLDQSKEFANTGAHYVLKDVTVVSGTRQVVSGVVKGGLGRDWSFVEVYSSGGTGGQYLSINLTDGSFTPSTGAGGVIIDSDVVDLGDGLYEWFIAFTASSATTRVIVSASDTASPSSRPSYAGDLAKGMHVGGLQVEYLDPGQTTPRAYNPTTSSAYFGPRKNVVYNGTNWEDKGLLVEGESANSLTYSRDFSNAAWLHTAEASVSSGVSVVDGATRNIVLTDDSGAVRLNKYINTSCPNDSNVNLFSLRVPKTSGASHFPMMQALLTGGTAQQVVAILDTDTGVVTAITETGTVTSQAEDFDDHWLWWSTVLNNSTGNTTARMLLNPAGSTNGTTLDNAATGSTAMDYATIELNTSTPTTPIETVASAVTRTVDDVTRATTSLPGTILLKGRTAPSIGSSENQTILEIGDGTNDDRVAVNRAGTDGALDLGMRSGAATVVTEEMKASIGNDVDFAVAIRLEANNVAFSYDGGAVVTDTSCALPTGITTMYLGNSNLSRPWGGSILSITEFTSPLPDDALVGLSS